MLAAFEYRHPDRIPLYYHPSEAGLYVHGQKLLDLFREYPSDNPITFNALPTPPADAFDADGRYYEEKTDEWGVRWAYRIFGIQGHPAAHPFGSWKEGLKYPLPVLSDLSDPANAELVRRSLELRKDHLLIEGWVTTFMQLYALRPMEDVLIDLAVADDDLLRYIDRLIEFWHIALDNMILKGVDVIMFADDWATQSGPMVSPSIFRSHFKPLYREMFEKVHAAGRKVFFHCCGDMGYVLDELLELGVDALWPQIGLYEGEDFPNRLRDAGVTIFIHPDRQRLIPLGTHAQIRDAIARYAERYHRLGGGGIFYVEIENDAPFENVEALITSIDKYR
jgi:hypothetical protein